MNVKAVKEPTPGQRFVQACNAEKIGNIAKLSSVSDSRWTMLVKNKVGRGWTRYHSVKGQGLGTLIASVGTKDTADIYDNRFRCLVWRQVKNQKGEQQ
jgi:hypothetical protein